MTKEPTVFWGAFDTKQASDGRLRRHPDAVEMSKPEMFLASCTNILRNVYGFTKTIEQGTPLDITGNPLPLLTYPAIEYLVQFDLSNKTIFEYGAGSSTLFWQARAKHVLSVENNLNWFNHLRPLIRNNVNLILVQGDKFPWAIENTEQCYDIIVIDGAGYRYDCATAAVNRLCDGGLIVLDNADWHPNTAALLRGKGLLQVDMTGFKPGECHTSTTSLFFHRAFDFKPLNNRQPQYGMGAKLIHSVDWDKPYAKR